MWCLKSWSHICNSTGLDKRCCVIQCALSLQCCCHVKRGRLRIVPYETEQPSGEENFPPPPSYLDIYPDDPGGSVEEYPTPLELNLGILNNAKYSLKFLMWISLKKTLMRPGHPPQQGAGLRAEMAVVDVPEFWGIFLLNFASLIHKVSVLFQKVDPFLRVGCNVVVLVL